MEIVGYEVDEAENSSCETRSTRLYSLEVHVHDDNEMKYMKIVYDGMEFYFQSYSQNEILREVQLFLISSEIYQAVGRARLLRNECTVTLLSNFPVKQAEFRYIKY